MQSQILPLLYTLRDFGNVKMIYQDVPPCPDKNPAMNYYGSSNSYVVSAFNYYMYVILRQAGVTVIRTWAIGLPWSENFVGGRRHLVELIRPHTFNFTPPGRLATDLIMYHACV